MQNQNTPIENQDLNTTHSDAFAEQDFLSKVRETMGKIPFMKEVVAMYFCMIDANTPIWVKGLILAALGYFISPIDAIPDFLIFIGYADDAAVITGVSGTVTMHIQPIHHQRAEEWLLMCKK